MLCWCAQFEREKLHGYMTDLSNHTVNHLLTSYFINLVSLQDNERKGLYFSIYNYAITKRQKLQLNNKNFLHLLEI